MLCCQEIHDTSHLTYFSVSLPPSLPARSCLLSPSTTAQISSEEEGVITLLGALGEDGGRMHGMEENEVRDCRGAIKLNTVEGLGAALVCCQQFCLCMLLL